MMPRKYYCLVAGLPNISLEDSKLSYGSEDFLKDMADFAPADFGLFDMFRHKIDNENIYKILVDHEHKFVPGGVYGQSMTEEIIEEPVRAVSYIREFVEEYHSEEFDREVDRKRLTVLYYEFVTGQKNKFLRNWFELELNTKNIFAALNAKKFGLKIENEIINVNSVAETMIKSTSRDFGLSGELDYTDRLLSIFENDDLIKREKEIDLFRWDWLDENTFFEYFTIEKLISYYIKLTIIERWIKLDPASGKELFDRFRHDLESGYEVPAEFKKK
jgi:hypothetical protein